MAALLPLFQLLLFSMSQVCPSVGLAAPALFQVRLTAVVRKNDSPEWISDGRSARPPLWTISTLAGPRLASDWLRFKTGLKALPEFSAASAPEKVTVPNLASVVVPHASVIHSALDLESSLEVEAVVE